jgi:ParB/RepB/Spo0J family partition protein
MSNFKVKANLQKKTKVDLQDPNDTKQVYGIHGNRPEGQTDAPAPTRRLITIPIEKIRPNRYQKRETIDEDKFEQLKNQIQELGFQFTAIVCEDPDDPSYFNLMMGGHIRIEAAKSVGITEVQAIKRDYDHLKMAKGTYFENNGRQPLTLMEEGLLFQQLKDEEGWTHAKIADELKVSDKHVELCIAVTMAAPDIQDMLKIDGRGQRCFYYLRRLEELGREKAIEVRAPIIRDFLDNKISTDEVKHLVEQILKKEKGETAEEVTIEAAKGKEKVVSVYKSFQRFEKVLGDRSPSQAEREELARVRERIDAILERP